IPSACICELMGEYGKAMSKDEAVEYAYKEESIFLEGAEIIEYWNERTSHPILKREAIWEEVV
ncbi:MAG: hypothetical protein AB1779_11740, partial [Candidatus Thermoplasmatota archaeon]